MDKEVIIDIDSPKDNDLISRQAVIERLKKEDKILYTTMGLNYLIRAIEELPPVTPKTEWIPVSEKLPDKNKYNHGSVWERSVLVTAYYKWDDAKHTFIGTRLAEDVINNNFIDECIKAWMPLPKPYEPQERSE